MNYTVDYFISKFEAIPEELWCVGEMSDGTGRHCALGHCAGRDFFPWTEEAGSFANMFYKLKKYASAVNNGDDWDYQQPTPKQRILAALFDIKKMQEAEKPKREKIKVQISPDLIEPPIPKEVEKIDRPDEVIELEEKQPDLFKMVIEALNPVQVELATAQIGMEFTPKVKVELAVSEATYLNYKYNRNRAPEITPTQWEKVYGDTWAMELRYQFEKNKK